MAAIAAVISLLLFLFSLRSFPGVYVRLTGNLSSSTFEKVLDDVYGDDAPENCEARCPRCLPSQYTNLCLPSEYKIREHKDCGGNDGPSNPLCSRSLWLCPNTGVYFTNPFVTEEELNYLYTKKYNGQATLQMDSPRVLAQFDYINKHVIGNPKVSLHSLNDATVMEIGCAKGFLLSRVCASPLITNAICFEATPGFGEHAKANVQENKGVNATIFSDTWNASMIDHNSVDLFISSHVLEHFSDLCHFLKELYDRMKPGGVVFSEVPNHTPKYVSETFGGQFHLTLTTHKGHLLLMEAVGFQMVDMTLIGADERTAYPNGFHIRSIFVKPPHKSQTEAWKGLGT